MIFVGEELDYFVAHRSKNCIITLHKIHVIKCLQILSYEFCLIEFYDVRRIQSRIEIFIDLRFTILV